MNFLQYLYSLISPKAATPASPQPAPLVPVNVNLRPTPAPVGNPAPEPILADPASPMPPALVALGEIWQRGTVPPVAAKMLASFESFRPLPYDDNGAKSGGTWTIGYGSIRDANGKPVGPNTPAITEAEALKLKQRDMQTAAYDLDRLVSVSLTNNQAAALISFMYNFGTHALVTSTLLKRVNAKASNKEVGEELKQWRNQRNAQGVLLPVLGLVRRRHAEWGVFAGQPWPSARSYAWAKINNLSDWPPLNI